MKKNTSSALFERWKAFYRVEPWGDDWRQTATIACAAANPHLKKGLKAEDIIPHSKPNIGMTALDEMEAWAKALAGFGAT